MEGIYGKSERAKDLERKISSYRGLSAAETKRRILDEQEEEESHGSGGNTGLPFGLCKKYGISLPERATPRDAWNALKDKTGMSPQDFYEKLKAGKESEAQDIHAVQATESRAKSSTSHMSEAARAVFDNFQTRTRGVLHEEAVICDNAGNIILSKSGTSNRVRFTMREAEMMRGANLIHNHPSHCSILSPDDVNSLYDHAKCCTMCDLDGHRMSIVYDDSITDIERIQFSSAYSAAFMRATKKVQDEFLSRGEEAEATLYSDIKRQKRYYQDYALYQELMKKEIKAWTDANASKYKVEVYYE